MQDAKKYSASAIIGVIIVCLIVGFVLGRVADGLKSSGDQAALVPLYGQASPPDKMTGNGALSGAHYNLNLIGVPKGKTADMTGDNGRRIFMNLFGNTKVLLNQSFDGTFSVLDANGTDGNGASFQLPAPGDYKIYARALGKPGGSSTLTTCAYDPVSGEDVCSTDMLVSVRGTGKSSFTNVTKELTTIDIDPALAAALSLTCQGTIDIFDSCLQNYFWSYDNNGLKLLQLRFYKI
jgi:hypothetical protein